MAGTQVTTVHLAAAIKIDKLLTSDIVMQCIMLLFNSHR
jgi:hypothetical protein